MAINFVQEQESCTIKECVARINFSDISTVSLAMISIDQEASITQEGRFASIKQSKKLHACYLIGLEKTGVESIEVVKSMIITRSEYENHPTTDDKNIKQDIIINNDLNEDGTIKEETLMAMAGDIARTISVDPEWLWAVIRDGKIPVDQPTPDFTCASQTMNVHAASSLPDLTNA